MERKTNPNAKLKTLAEETQSALWEFFAEDASRKLSDAVPWLKSEWDVETNVQRLSEWRGWYARKVSLEEAQSEASEIEEMLARSGKYDAKQLEELGNVIFLNRATKLGDAAMFRAVASVVQNRERIDDARTEHADKMSVAMKKLEQNQQRLKQMAQTIELQRRKIEAMEADERARQEAAKSALERATSGGASDEAIALVREALGMKV